jgi:hypothetical protein
LFGLAAELVRWLWSVWSAAVCWWSLWVWRVLCSAGGVSAGLCAVELWESAGVAVLWSGVWVCLRCSDWCWSLCLWSRVGLWGSLAGVGCAVGSVIVGLCGGVLARRGSPSRSQRDLPLNPPQDLSPSLLLPLLLVIHRGAKILPLRPPAPKDEQKKSNLPRLSPLSLSRTLHSLSQSLLSIMSLARCLSSLPQSLQSTPDQWGSAGSRSSADQSWQCPAARGRPLTLSLSQHLYPSTSRQRMLSSCDPPPSSPGVQSPGRSPAGGGRDERNPTAQHPGASGLSMRTQSVRGRT